MSYLDMAKAVEIRQKKHEQVVKSMKATDEEQAIIGSLDPETQAKIAIFKQIIPSKVLTYNHLDKGSIDLYETMVKRRENNASGYSRTKKQG